MYVTGPPKLKNNAEISIAEGIRNVAIDLRMYLTDSVLATNVSFSKSDEDTSTPREFSVSLRNATLVFRTITRKHSGLYTLYLTNDCVVGDTDETKTEVGSIALNVLCKCIIQLHTATLVIYNIFWSRWSRNDCRTR